jgi:hypothetical protein
MRQAWAVAFFFMLAGTALAQAPACECRYESVRHEVATAGLSTDKEVQVKALLEQVARACKEKNEVVAMAGLDQVQAILTDERKGVSGGS